MRGYGNRVNVDRVRELCAKGLNAEQIARRLGVTREAVRAVCKKHGFTVAVVGSASQDSCSVSNVSPHIENCGSRSS